MLPYIVISLPHRPCSCKLQGCARSRTSGACDVRPVGLCSATCCCSHNNSAPAPTLQVQAQELLAPLHACCAYCADKATDSFKMDDLAVQAQQLGDRLTELLQYCQPR